MNIFINKQNLYYKYRKMTKITTETLSTQQISKELDKILEETTPPNPAILAPLNRAMARSALKSKESKLVHFLSEETPNMKNIQMAAHQYVETLIASGLPLEHQRTQRLIISLVVYDLVKDARLLSKQYHSQQATHQYALSA